MSGDRNSLAHWFPPVEAAGLPVPRTRIVETPYDLTNLLDGEMPFGFSFLVEDLRSAGDELGWPAFLRTGHGSGKHQWRKTCFVPSPGDVGRHVAALVEWSHAVDLRGLPTNVWAIRELIPTAPLFVCEGYGGLPVVREFRLFVHDDQLEHRQPYWPSDAVERGQPDAADWRARLAAASAIGEQEVAHLRALALAAVGAVGGGYWSVDLLQGRSGKWWLTDMAEGECSFRWEPE